MEKNYDLVLLKHYNKDAGGYTPYMVTDNPGAVISLSTNSVLYLGDMDEAQSKYDYFRIRYTERNCCEYAESLRLVPIPTIQTILDNIALDPKEGVFEIYHDLFD